jgi:YD repeat-containing protein
MALRQINLFIIVSMVILTSLPAITLATEPSDAEFAAKVAQTMREMQSRYRYRNTSSTDFLNWYSCLCNNVNTPPYPPDTFFLYCIKNNPDERISLVQNVAYNFPYVFHRSQYPIYFVKEKYWPKNIINTPDLIETYSQYDFPSIPGYEYIDASNYWGVLCEVHDIVTGLLKYTSTSSMLCNMYSIQCPSENKTMRRDGGGWERSCEDAKGEASYNYEKDEPNFCDDFNPIVRETSVYSSGYNSCDTELWGTKFRLVVDLLGYNGSNTAEVSYFNKIKPLGDGFSNTSTSGFPSATQNWQPGNGTPDLNSLWLSPEYLYDAKFEMCTCPTDQYDYYGWEWDGSIGLIECIFPTEVNDIGYDSAEADVYKQDHTVYAANEKCDSWWMGETVDGFATPLSSNWLSASDKCITVRLAEPYNTKVATVYIPVPGLPTTGWDGVGMELKDPTQIVCYTSLDNLNRLRFSVRAKAMKDKAAPVPVKLSVTFWRQDSQDVTYYSEKIIELAVKPNQGDICCNEDACQFFTIKTGNAEEGLFCLYKKNPEVFEHAGNGDIEVHLPDRKSDWYIMAYPPPFFTDPWEVSKSGNDIIVTYGYSKKYIFTSHSPYKLTSITDSQDNELVTFEYDQYSRLKKQEDATDPNYYITYDYNDLTDFNDSPQRIVVQAYDVNRVYTIQYDSSGRAVAVGIGSCTCSCNGSSGAVRYVFDANDFIKQERSYDTNEVIYEYDRDSYGRILGKWRGAKDSNNCIQKTFYTEDSNGAVVDIYDYIDANSYRVTREYRNAAGLVTKQVKYQDLNEAPNNPQGNSFAEYNFYIYDSNDIMIKKTVILPLWDSNGSPDPNTAVRKEYAYDPNTGSMLTEKWFGQGDVNFIVSSYTYDYIRDSNDRILSSRVLTYKDAREAVTRYYYDGNDTEPNLKIMPEVTMGISGTKQLKYRYTYDDRGRIVFEEQLNASNSVTAKTKNVYDDFGNLIRRHDYRAPDINDSNEVTKYEYNGFNEMIKMTLPSGVIQGWSYNQSGKTEYEVVYDPCDLNYVYSKTKYFYDGNDRLNKVAKAVFSSRSSLYAEPNDTKWVWTEYEYDLWGNKTKVIEDANGLALATTYEYNNQGEETKVTLPNGKWTKTIRDGRGLVTEQIVGYHDTEEGKDVEFSTWFEYDANGNLIWQTAPNLIKTKYEYDDFDRLHKVTKGL